MSFCRDIIGEAREIYPSPWVKIMFNIFIFILVEQGHRKSGGLGFIPLITDINRSKLASSVGYNYQLLLIRLSTILLAQDVGVIKCKLFILIWQRPPSYSYWRFFKIHCPLLLLFLNNKVIYLSINYIVVFSLLSF